MDRHSEGNYVKAYPGIRRWSMLLEIQSAESLSSLYIEHARWYSRRSKSRFPDSSEKTSHGEILMSNLHVHSFASNESFFLFPVLFLFIDFHTGYLSRHGGGVTLFPILPFPHSHPWIVASIPRFAWLLIDRAKAGEFRRIASTFHERILLKMISSRSIRGDTCT